ncbi:MAG: ATP-binding protein [Steroidobacteraceae bacterium]
MTYSGSIDVPASRGRNPIGRRPAWGLALGYVLLYAYGYLSKPVPSSAAIWPADALSFAAFLLLPLRAWPLVTLFMVCSELLLVPLLNWISGEPTASLAVTVSFGLANVLTTACPAGLVRLWRLFRPQARAQLVISPIWIVALFAGVVPGALLGSMTRAHSAGMAFVPADMGLWLLSSVLTIVTFGPAVIGMLLGFSEPARPSARSWEGWAVSGIVAVLFVWFTLVPWPTAGRLVEPMLFAVPLIWLALRFSRRATSIAVAIVASGVVLIAGHGAGAQQHLANIDNWRDVVISIDIFLLTGCGGALLINLMTLKQRALLEELAHEHAQLQHYAQALDSVEESARRATAADLHDGVGQVLAGQSMTLAAMRAHARHPPLAELLDEAAEASREAQEGLRVMIQDLSPPELEHASLDEMLQWLTDLFKTRFGFSVTGRVTTNAELPRDQLRLVYRCIRELLMNACKHSQRRSAEVEVDVSPASVDITVIDEGVGFDVHRALRLSGHRFGLAQLRERVRAAGGVIDIDAIPGEGCRVTVKLPWSSVLSPSPDKPSQFAAG